MYRIYQTVSFCQNLLFEISRYITCFHTELSYLHELQKNLISKLPLQVSKTFDVDCLLLAPPESSHSRST